MKFLTNSGGKDLKTNNLMMKICSMLVMFLIITTLLLSNKGFSQSVTEESFHIKLRRITQSDTQKHSIPLPEVKRDGLRIKSSSYKDALNNQTNFQGYNTERPKNFTLDKEGSFLSETEIHEIQYVDNNSPKMILTNSIAVMGYQAKELFSFREKDLIYIGAISGITIGLIALDAKLDNSVKNIMGKKGTFDDVTDFITDFGAENSLYTVAGFAGLSYITRSKKGIQTSLYAFEAMLNSGLWIRLGKLLAGRERPEATYEYSKRPGGIWRGPIHQIINKEKRSVASYDAFPSGHTATIFSVATVFAEQYKDIKIVPIFSYTFASIVGISRMLEHAHWASDVFLGACIGYFCGKRL